MSTAAVVRQRVKQRLKLLQEQQASSDGFNAQIPGNWAEFAALTRVASGGRIVPFVPYPFQRDLIATVEASPNVVVNKSRQTGISETISNWMLWRATREPGFTGIVFSKTQQDAGNLAGRIRLAATTLGPLCPEFLTDSKLEVAFRGYGRVLFLPPTARAARGIPSASVIFADEAAFIDKAEEIYTAAAPTLSMLGDRGRYIVVSTPNGRSGWFYQLWTNGGDAWTKIRVHYSEHPVYAADPTWAERTREQRRLTERQWQQEYELSFEASDAGVFRHDLLEQAARGEYSEGLATRTYILGVDPSFGGDDYFTAVVVDVTDEVFQVVAMHHANNQSSEYNIRKTCDLIDDFNPVVVAIESNSGGRVVAEAIQATAYSANVELVTTTATSKRTNTDRLVYLLEHDRLVLPNDEAFLTDFRNFRQDEKGRREAAHGFHDDIVMATAIALSQSEDMSSWVSRWVGKI